MTAPPYLPRKRGGKGEGCGPLSLFVAHSRARPLFHSHVLGEIVVDPAFALETPAYALAVIAARKDLGQEALLRGPAGIGLRLAVPARHGVVQPTVGGALVDVNVVAFMVGFEAVAKTLHVLERDDVVGLAEGRKDRAGKRCNHRFERPRLQLVDLPFALGSGTVPHHRSADRRLRSEYERVPPGLAVSGDNDFAQVRGRVLRQGRESDLDQFHRLR